MADEERDNEPVGYKVATALAALVAGFVSKKALSLIWTKVRGAEPPDKPERLDVDLADAVTWAAVSAVVAAVVRVLAQRQAAATWHRANGTLPASADR